MSSWLRRLVPTSPLGRAVFFASVLFLGWATWHARRELRHPFWDLSRGTFSDHISHVNAVRLFTRCGACVWRVPVERQFPRVTPAEYQALPKDISSTLGIREIFRVDGWPTDKPLITNWPQIVRPYPPGELVLMAPFAATYHWVTDLTFTRANWSLVLWLLLLAHVAFGALLYVSLATPPEQRTLGFFALGLVYLEMVHWSLEGFYDAAGVAPLVLSCVFLAQRRGLPALVWYCVAAFIHYRAFFLAPVPVYALWLIIHERSWQSWQWPQYAALVLACALGVAALWTFRWIQPALGQFPLTNAAHLTSKDRAAQLTLGLVAFAAAAAFVRSGAWLDVAILAVMGAAFSTVRQACPWHVVLPMAWFALPAVGAAGERTRLVGHARVAVIVVASLVVFGNGLFPRWLGQVIGA